MPWKNILVNIQITDKQIEKQLKYAVDYEKGESPTKREVKEVVRAIKNYVKDWPCVILELER